jgi:hypothetical protein
VASIPGTSLLSDPLVRGIRSCRSINAFRNLSTDELNTVARIYDITSSIIDFCKTPDDAFHTLCVCCIESIDLPPAPADITSIMLANALEAHAIWDTMHNQAIHEAIHDIDSWREAQRAALIDGLVMDITSEDTNPENLARILGTLDPRIEAWVNTFRLKLKETIIKMVSAEPLMDHLTPQAQEILENAWHKKWAFITEELQAWTLQLSTETDQILANRKNALQEEANEHLHKFQTNLDTKTADEIQQMKNKSKSALQTTKDNEEESRTLSLAVHTPKATKLSPLNISKLKRKKKKVTILDLTMPPPGNEASTPSTDMGIDTDSTPTTPICRSTALSPGPFPQAPATVSTGIANPETIPRWARTPSLGNQTPHAPVFPAATPAPPAPTNNLMAIIVTGLENARRL